MNCELSNCCKSEESISVLEDEIEPIVTIDNQVLPTNENKFISIFKLLTNLKNLKKNENDLKEQFNSVLDSNKFKNLAQSGLLTRLNMKVKTTKSTSLQTIQKEYADVLELIDLHKKNIIQFIKDGSLSHLIVNVGPNAADQNTPDESCIDEFINWLLLFRETKASKIPINNPFFMPPTTNIPDTSAPTMNSEYLDFNTFKVYMLTWGNELLRNYYVNGNFLSPYEYFISKFYSLKQNYQYYYLTIESHKLLDLCNCLQTYFYEQTFIKPHQTTPTFRMTSPVSNDLFVDHKIFNIEIYNMNNIEQFYGTVIINTLERKHAIGRGTFGKVYLAKSLKTNKYYAVKLRKKNLEFKYTYENLMNNCEDEKKMTIKALPSRYTVTLMAVLQTHHEIFFVMEYVSNVNLQHVMRSKKLSQDEVLFYSLELIYALYDLHNLGVMHRDLKPDNVLIDQNGHCKLADFNLAKVIRNGRRSKTICHQPPYQPPEMLDGSGYDETMDYWSLGMIIFIAVYDMLPYDTIDEITNRLDPFSRITIQPYIHNILQKLLSFDPNLRRFRESDFDPDLWNKLKTFQLQNPDPPEYDLPDTLAKDPSKVDEADNIMFSQFDERALISWDDDIPPPSHYTAQKVSLSWINSEFRDELY